MDPQHIPLNHNGSIWQMIVTSPNFPPVMHLFQLDPHDKNHYPYVEFGLEVTIKQTECIWFVHENHNCCEQQYPYEVRAASYSPKTKFQQAGSAHYHQHFKDLQDALDYGNEQITRYYNTKAKSLGVKLAV